MTLNDWQLRFELHFSRLWDERRGNPARSTVYALEHGLSADERNRFLHDVRQGNRPGQRAAQGHRLVWTVYATEIGYGYSGEEYWATFANQTPSWEDSNPSREYIRTSFKEFQARYGGAEPRGRWANHFSIICWPITHAILPQDLQRELAHSLYRIRYEFDSTLLANPSELGRAIANDAELVAGSRFRQFAEDHLLVGQIAASLLLEEQDLSKSHVLPITLIRITDDLTKSRRSLEWLLDARENASRARYIPRTIIHQRHSYAPTQRQQESTSPTATDRGFKPSLSLRQTAKENWTVYLRLPDGQALIRRMPELREILRNRGCYVTGTQGTRLARGRFLYKGQDVALRAWPASDEPLFRFEGVDEETNIRLATAGCILPAKRQWVFKILGDGSATEIASQIVRPDESYILLRIADGRLEFPRQAISQSVSCDGVDAYRLDLPDVLPAPYRDTILRAGLSLSEGLWARPIGSISNSVDSELDFAWSFPNRPTLQVSSDFEASSVEFALSRSSGEHVSDCTVQKLPVILDLSPLDSGSFVLEVRAHHYGSSRIFSETYSIAISNPDAEERARSVASPFLLDVSPAQPSLEDLWESRAAINIYAPRGTGAEVRIQLAAGDRKNPQVFSKRLDLPCDEEEWTQYLKLLKQDKPLRNGLDAATRCSIEFDCGALGHRELKLDRRPTPIRWVSREKNSGCYLRLEELDRQAEVTCITYSFSRPMEPVEFAGDPRVEFRENGANLYLAKTVANAHASVIAAAPIRSFSSLRETPFIPLFPRSEACIRTLLTVYHLWYSTRVVGDASAFDKRDDVVAAISKEIIRLLCGDTWVRLEHGHRGRADVLALKQSISPKSAHISAIALVSQGQVVNPESTIDGAVNAINELCLSHHLLDGQHDVLFSHALVDFAYRLLNQPESLSPADGHGERAVIESLLRNPVLCRMVRFSYVITEPAHGVDAAISGES
jgi:hypothetical protein